MVCRLISEEDYSFHDARLREKLDEERVCRDKK